MTDSPANQPGTGARPPLSIGPRCPAWLIAVVLALVTMTVYWRATRCDFTNYDDPDYVSSNPQVLTGLTLGNVAWAFTTINALNWHPLTWISLMLDASVFGTGPAGFHFTNVAWHAANVALLFLLLRRLTAATWRSALVAALFGWHPAHVQSVAWISERKDVLSTFFGLLAIWFYTGYVRTRSAGRRSGWGGYGLALVCFALGLLSKSMLVTWPFVLLLLDYWPLARWRKDRARLLVLEKIPFLVLAVAASVMTFVAQKHGGAVVSVGQLALPDRAAYALISYWRYLGMLAWPVDLAVFYPHANGWSGALVAVAVVLLAGFTFFVHGERRRYPFLLVGWLWYLGTLVPVIGLVQVGSQAIADRYTYIPSVGVFVMVVWAVSGLARERRLAVSLATLCAAGLMACLAGTWHQLGYWRDSETLFRHDLAVTKDNVVAHDNLGAALLDHDEPEAAISEYHTALGIAPNSPDAENNLSVALYRNGQNEDAVNELQKLLSQRPDDAEAHNNFGSVLLKQGRSAEAMSQFKKTLSLNPNSPQAHDNLGLALVGDGQVNAAIGEFQDAVRLSPASAFYRDNLGLVLAQAGRTQEAIEQWRQALRQRPGDAAIHGNLGDALDKIGQEDAAIHEWEEAVRLDPDTPHCRENLDAVMLRRGQVDQAINQFQEAVRLRPDFAVSRNDLALALFRRDRLTDAVAQWREAIRLEPAKPEFHENLGRALAAHDQVTAAIGEFQETVRLAPDQAGGHDDLGKAMGREGRWEEARSQFREALRLDPENFRFHGDVGIVLANQGRMDEAAREFRTALTLNPEFAKAHDNLGIVLSRQGQLDPAIHEYREALRLQPGYADAQTNLSQALAEKSGSSRADSESANH